MAEGPLQVRLPGPDMAAQPHPSQHPAVGPLPPHLTASKPVGGKMEAQPALPLLQDLFPPLCLALCCTLGFPLRTRSLLSHPLQETLHA